MSRRSPNAGFWVLGGISLATILLWIALFLWGGLSEFGLQILVVISLVGALVIPGVGARITRVGISLGKDSRIGIEAQVQEAKEAAASAQRLARGLGAACAEQVAYRGRIAPPISDLIQWMIRKRDEIRGILEDEGLSDVEAWAAVRSINRMIRRDLKSEIASGLQKRFRDLDPRPSPAEQKARTEWLSVWIKSDAGPEALPEWATAIVDESKELRDHRRRLEGFISTKSYTPPQASS